MITFKNRLNDLALYIQDIIERDEIHLSDLIELKEKSNVIRDIIDSYIDDVIVDIDK